MNYAVSISHEPQITYVMTSDRNICYEHALSIQLDCFWRECTVAHNCHTKRSKQLQIAHSKLQIAHSTFKSPYPSEIYLFCTILSEVSNK